MIHLKKMKHDLGTYHVPKSWYAAFGPSVFNPFGMLANNEYKSNLRAALIYTGESAFHRAGSPKLCCLQFYLAADTQSP